MMDAFHVMLLAACSVAIMVPTNAQEGSADDTDDSTACAYMITDIHNQLRDLCEPPINIGPFDFGLQDYCESTFGCKQSVYRSISLVQHACGEGNEKVVELRRQVLGQVDVVCSTDDVDDTFCYEKIDNLRKAVVNDDVRGLSPSDLCNTCTRRYIRDTAFLNGEYLSMTLHLASATELLCSQFTDHFCGAHDSEFTFEENSCDLGKCHPCHRIKLAASIKTASLGSTSSIDPSTAKARLERTHVDCLKDSSGDFCMESLDACRSEPVSSLEDCSTATAGQCSSTCKQTLKTFRNERGCCWRSQIDAGIAADGSQRLVQLMDDTCDVEPKDYCDGVDAEVEVQLAISNFRTPERLMCDLLIADISSYLGTLVATSSCESVSIGVDTSPDGRYAFKITIPMLHSQGRDLIQELKMRSSDGLLAWTAVQTHTDRIDNAAPILVEILSHEEDGFPSIFANWATAVSIACASLVTFCCCTCCCKCCRSRPRSPATRHLQAHRTIVSESAPASNVAVQQMAFRIRSSQQQDNAPSRSAAARSALSMDDRVPSYRTACQAAPMPDASAPPAYDDL